MNAIFRTNFSLFLLAALIGAGCSDDAPLAVEPTQPTPAPGTLSEVTIGCQSGIDAEVRTSLGDRNAETVEVRWTTDDTFRLAAREHLAVSEQGTNDEQGTNSNWLFNDALFALQIYSSEWNIANFVGQVDVSLFEPEKKYDYIAFSPQPDAIKGEKATFTIPAEQTGDNFASIRHLDIMSASLTNAQPLQAGLTEPAINLAFTHHTHILEFTIPQNNLGEDIRFVKLTFPQPVTGQMEVDALKQTATLITESNEPNEKDAGKELKIKFSTPKKEGDTFYAAIAPIALKQNDQIQILVGGSTGYSQLTYTCQAESRPMEAGHLTPINLLVSSKTDYQTLTFQLPADLGTGTLGEKVTKVKVTAPSANAFQEAMCEEDAAGNINGVLSADAKELTYSVTGNSYTVRFMPEWTTDLSSNWTFTYESENTLGLSYQCKATNHTFNLSVPYLFEEDFSKMTETNEWDSNYTGGSNAGAKDGHTFNTNLSGTWSGARCGVSAGKAIRLAARRETSASYPARVDSAPLSPIKEGKKVSVSVSYNYSSNQDKGGISSKNRAKICHFGYTDTTADHVFKSDAEDGTFDNSDQYTISASENDGSYTQIGHSRTHTLSGCSNVSRLTWRLEVEHNAGLNNNTCWLYLDNIKVSIKQ